MRRLMVLGLLGGLICAAPAVAQYPVRAEVAVSDWYQRFLRRPVDQSGMTNWADQLTHGRSDDKVLADILGSDEYYARGGSTPEGFVRTLFQDLLSRPPTYGELEYWRTIADNDGRPAAAISLLQRYPDTWRPRPLPPPRPLLPPSPYERR